MASEYGPHDVELEVTVEHCARCGLDHGGIAFKPFGIAQIDDFTHWSICPETGEPILMKIWSSAIPMTPERESDGQ